MAQVLRDQDILRIGATSEAGDVGNAVMLLPDEATEV